MTLTTYQRLYVIPFAPLWALRALGARTVFGDAALGASATRLDRRAGVTVLPPSCRRCRTRRGRASSSAGSRRIAWHSRRALRIRASRARAVPGAPDFAAWTTGRPTLWISREVARLYPGWPDTTSLTRPPRDGPRARPQTRGSTPIRAIRANLPRNSAP
jgi:hypothetical protein